MTLKQDVLAVTSAEFFSIIKLIVVLTVDLISCFRENKGTLDFVNAVASWSHEPNEFYISS